MNIFWAISIFVIGIIMLIFCGDWFVGAASWIARAIKIPPFIVGATIVSFATTLPEMIVSLIASVQGKNDMAIGNAVGSVSANTGLIMAIAFVFMTVCTPRKDYWKQITLLLLASAILWVGCLTGTLSLWASIVLMAIFVVAMVCNIMDARRNTTPETVSAPLVITKKDTAKNIVLFIVGAVGIVVGSNLLINGGSTNAESLGIPERIIGITMVAIGTSLPELVTTLTAIRKKEASLSVGNIIGANIIDLSLILPICSFVSGEAFTVSTQCLHFDFPACLLICVVALMPLLFKQRASKWQGVLLLTGYLTYLIISSIF